MEAEKRKDSLEAWGRGSADAELFGKLGIKL